MEEPKKCPYCGKDFSIRSFDNATVDLTHFGKVGFCIFCNKPIFFAYEREKQKRNEVLCAVYPTKGFSDLPEEIQYISPTFKLIFDEIMQANALNLNSIIGPGLHKALEQLITDYLIEVQNENKMRVLKLKTIGRINLLNPNLYSTAAAHIVRIFGNDETHFEKRYNINKDKAIECINALCVLMASRYKTFIAEELWDNIK